jgi:hypothetical protein
VCLVLNALSLGVHTDMWSACGGAWQDPTVQVQVQVQVQVLVPVVMSVLMKLAGGTPSLAHARVERGCVSGAGALVQAVRPSHVESNGVDAAERAGRLPCESPTTHPLYVPPATASLTDAHTLIQLQEALR